MKKNTAILILCVCITIAAHAQTVKYYYDGYTYFQKEVVIPRPFIQSTFLNFQFGLSNYLGDLGGSSGVGKGFWWDNNFKSNTFLYGISLTKYWKDAFGIRLSFNTGNIRGGDHDAAFKNENDPAYQRFKRNLNFRSKITEGSLMLEIIPFKFLFYKSKAHQSDIQLYGMAGIGVFKFNPQGSYFDNLEDDYVWVDLHPLMLEGQGMAEYPDRKPYKLTQINIPYGLGIRYHITPKTYLAIEYLGRKLFTDYLDDVSTNYINPNLFPNYLGEEDAQKATILNNKSNIISISNPYKPNDKRGNPQKNDFYYSMGIKLSFIIARKKPLEKVYYQYDLKEHCK